MPNKYKYTNDDLVLLVWPRQSYLQVAGGQSTWDQVAHGNWAMSSDKAERVKVLVAVHDDEIVGAWAVTSAENHMVAPAGKDRNVNRATFVLADDDRLHYLVGAPSPRPRQRNPQTTFEMRDLPGAEVLVAGQPAPSHGVIQLGNYVLTVTEDGRADLRVPPGSTVTVRTAA